MTLTTTGSTILTAEQVGPLLIEPMIQRSIATQIAHVVRLSGSKYRVPIVTADPTAAWVAEGAEIPVTDAELDEAETTPSKLAGLTIISSELSEDSSPEAAQVVGNGLARDCAKKLDSAFFGTTVTNGPSGLGSLTGVGAVDAGTSWTNVDPFTDALLDAPAPLTAFVANKADAKLLAKLKQTSGSNQQLLQPDPTQPQRRMISGVPLYISPAVTAGTIWGLPEVDDQFVSVVIRDEAQIDVDSSVYFTSDRVAIRAKLRAGFNFPYTAAVYKISLSA